MKLDLIKFAAVLAAALPVAASATDTPQLGTSSVQLTELRYYLIDLNPDDGIDPTLTFNGTPSVRLFASLEGSSDDSRLVSSNPFDTGASRQVAQVGSSWAIVEGNSLSASSDIRINQASGSPYSNLATGSNVATVSTPSGGLSLTLSAQTALVVEGHAMASLHNDLTVLGSVPDAEINSSSEASISARLKLERDPLQDSIFSKYVYQTSTLMPMAGLFTDASNPDALNETFSLSISNTSNTSARGLLSLGLGATNTVSVRMFTSSIPEPGTWATFALGLAGMALVGRQRSKSNKRGEQMA